MKEGDSISIGDISLRILEVPGHHKDHIAILDEKNGNIFVGMMSIVSKVLRKEPKPLSEHMLQGIVEWLSQGYRIYKTRN